MIFALCYELDNILVEEGKEPYFVPGMRSIIATTGFEEHAKSFLKNIGIKDRVDKTDLESLSKFISNM